MGHWNSTPYDQRSDLEKIQSQWTKLSGHHNRTDWSAAVVRAATACEIAVNMAIRREFADRSDQFDAEFIDGLLQWANGLKGKIDRLLMPLRKTRVGNVNLQQLIKLAESINRKRNGIAHRGEFCSEQECTELVGQCEEFVTTLVRVYEPTFQLREVT